MGPQVHTSIAINAPPQHVWDVLLDFDAWGTWNTFITAIHTHSKPPELGTLVTFTNRLNDTVKPGTYNARLTTWDPAKYEFAWKGGPMPEVLGWVLQGHHWFKCVAETGEDGKEGTRTRFEHGEEVQGLASVLVPASMVKDLVGMLNRFNGELKKRVEGGWKVGES